MRSTKVVALEIAGKIMPFVALFLLVLGCDATATANKYGSLQSVSMILEIDPATHRLVAESKMEWSRSDPDSFYFILNNNLKILSGRSLRSGDSGKEDQIEAENFKKLGTGSELKAQLERLGVSHDPSDDYQHLAIYGLPIPNADPQNITIKYEGIIHDSVAVPSFSRWEIADETDGIISPEGVFLTPWTGYYPRLPGGSNPVRFDTHIYHPEGWKAIVEGKILEEDATSVHYTSEQPVDGCYLVAGEYKYKSIDQNGTEIGMYYYPDSEDLVDRYLQASAGYIEKYSEMFGPYLFSRFSVVENWFPTGYGMPTYTLLGSQVIRLPFIIYTSLGHEVAHNWWGNGVYVDYESGNWCEGLTTYCADYRYKEESSTEDARDYRMDVNRDYSDYIVRGDEEDFALVEFTERTTPGTRTIGYGKCMMVFHMLSGRIGRENFDKALRTIYTEQQLKHAGWNDLFDVFTRFTDEPLDWYQEQWVNQAGAPDISVDHVKLTKTEKHTLVEFDIIQNQSGTTYRLDVPVQIFFADGSYEEQVLQDVRGAMYHARIEVDRIPVRIHVDPGFDLFRVLHPLESPPTLAGFFGAESPLYVISDTMDEMGQAYRDLADALNRDKRAEIISSDELSPEKIENRTVLYLGDRKWLDISEGGYRLDDETVNGDNIAVVAAKRSDDNPSTVILYVWGESPGSIAALGRKLPHYGKYSYLAFSSGQNILKGKWTIEDSPLMKEVRQ